MSVIRWNAFREFDDLLARSSGLRTAHPAAAKNPGFTPLADISETEAGYVIELELPGLGADEVNVSVHEGVLAISGERKREDTSSGDESAEQDEPADPRPVTRLHRSERAYGAFERRFKLPKDADPDAVAARAKNGVLTLLIERRAEAARRAIEVQVA